MERKGETDIEDLIPRFAKFQPSYNEAQQCFLLAAMSRKGEGRSIEGYQMARIQ